MRLAMNQPVGMGQSVEEERELWTAGFEAKTASPPATGPGIMGTIIGGIQNLFSAAVPAAIDVAKQKVLYGTQTVAPTSMTYAGGTPQLLAPKSPFPTEYLLVGGAAFALLLLSRKRGKK